MKLYSFITLLICVLLIGSCSSDPATEQASTDIITPGGVLDVGNTGNASDLLVKFTLSDIRLADQIQLFIIPATGFSSVQDINIDDIPSSAIQEVVANRIDNRLKLFSSLTDINGNDLAFNTDYILAYAIIKDGLRSINQRTREFRMSDQHILIGKYIGQWNDNLYTNFAISTEINMAGLSISGPFYYSGSFSSCCGGENDGGIRITLEDEIITSFTYSQDLESFQGGPCDGTYTGTGELENNNAGLKLVINFEGNDCEGPHTGGLITLDRIE